MNKFIFFFRGINSIVDSEDKSFHLLSEWIRSLQTKGKYISGAPLIRDGVMVDDGGKAIKEFKFSAADNASGYVIIQVKNLDEAIAISKTCPVLADGGNITIRPLAENF